MIRGPGDPPAHDMLPGACTSLTLSVYHPANARASRARVHKALLSGLLADVEALDDGQPWPREFPEKKLLLVQMRSFPGTTMYKRVLFDPAGTERTTVTVDYVAETDADATGENTRPVLATTAACSQVVLYELWALVREGLGPGCLPAVRARYLDSFGGWVFSEVLRQQRLGAPIIALTDTARYPDGFLQGVETLLGDQALVAELSPEAATDLTKTVGREMSCFNGAVRLYRSGWSKDNDPGDHPIWLRRQVLPDGEKEQFAEFAFCNEILRELYVRPWERGREIAREIQRRVAEAAGRDAGAEEARNTRAGNPGRGGDK